MECHNQGQKIAGVAIRDKKWLSSLLGTKVVTVVIWDQKLLCRRYQGEKIAGRQNQGHYFLDGFGCLLSKFSIPINASPFVMNRQIMVELNMHYKNVSDISALSCAGTVKKSFFLREAIFHIYFADASLLGTVFR